MTTGSDTDGATTGNRDRERNHNRRVALGLALIALALALGVFGGNLRNDAGAFVDWMDGQRTLFVLCLVDAALVGWGPVREFLRGEWTPFRDASLRGREENNRD